MTKIKLALLLLFSVFYAHVKAQTSNYDSATINKLNEARKFLLGKGVAIDAVKAFGIYNNLATQGIGKAMIETGKLFADGKGVNRDDSMATFWYRKAGLLNLADAWYNLGLFYKNHDANQDFEKALYYFEKAGNMGDAQSKYAIAYLHYKGLGCIQNYNKAADLFYQGAIQGRSNSMYFYGLCLRNGYGVTQSNDSANYWLQKSAAKGYRMAINELANAEGENNNSNGNRMARNLATQLKDNYAAKNSIVNNFNKIDYTNAPTVLIGNYEGYIIRYDWSKKTALNSVPLKVNFTLSGNELHGQWIENDTLIMPIAATLNGSAIIFNDTKYKRKDHYNNKTGKDFVFKNANLQWQVEKDTIALVGNISMFSERQNEPDKPTFIYLKKVNSVKIIGKDSVKIDNKDFIRLDDTNNPNFIKDKVSVYPNPFINTITVDLALQNKCNVNLQLLDVNGKVVLEKNAGQLEKGTYNLPLYVKDLKQGTYFIKVIYGTKMHNIKIIHQ